MIDESNMIVASDESSMTVANDDANSESSMTVPNDESSINAKNISAEDAVTPVTKRKRTPKLLFDETSYVVSPFVKKPLHHRNK